MIKVLADSVNTSGNRMVTLEIEYPRFILAEVNTHRMLSKNSSSSRAIPKNATVLTAEPSEWGKNQPGMQAKEEIEDKDSARDIWFKARDSAIKFRDELAELGVHKQILNRITEPWMLMKTVISGTEWSNFLYLRTHKDAQPEFRVLAEGIRDALNNSIPTKLLPGQWHLPYIDFIDGKYYSSGVEYSLEEARDISVSCCAQVSYRKNDPSIEKARDIIKRLVYSDPMHASPLEHQATPIEGFYGVSHVDMNNNKWSGNLQGWVQYRKLLET